MRPQIRLCVCNAGQSWEMEQTGGVFHRTGDPPNRTFGSRWWKFALWKRKLMICLDESAQRSPQMALEHLVTTLTKRMAEDLTEYMHEQGIQSAVHAFSDIDTIERIEILRDLRLGAFDVLIGINLLREGLDIPECGLVTILDADKEGFLAV